MKLNFIIPVTGDLSQKFSDIEGYLKLHLSPKTQLHFENLEWGFPSVETELQGMFNGTEVVRLVMRGKSQHYDGVFVDCFDDPGVYACRELGVTPVIGPYQAAMTSALMTAERIGVITTDEAGKLSEERKAQMLGLSEHVVSIRALDLDVSDIRAQPEKVLAELVCLCADMVQRDRVGAICLGCTAMFYIADRLTEQLRAQKLNVNIIEPIRNGVLTLEKLVALGYENFIPTSADLSTLNWPIW